MCVKVPHCMGQLTDIGELSSSSPCSSPLTFQTEWISYPVLTGHSPDTRGPEAFVCMKMCYNEFGCPCSVDRKLHQLTQCNDFRQKDKNANSKICRHSLEQSTPDLTNKSVFWRVSFPEFSFTEVTRGASVTLLIICQLIDGLFDASVFQVTGPHFGFTLVSCLPMTENLSTRGLVNTIPTQPAYYQQLLLKCASHFRQALIPSLWHAFSLQNRCSISVCWHLGQSEMFG